MEQIEECVRVAGFSRFALHEELPPSGKGMLAVSLWSDTHGLAPHWSHVLPDGPHELLSGMPSSNFIVCADGLAAFRYRACARPNRFAGWPADPGELAADISRLVCPVVAARHVCPSVGTSTTDVWVRYADDTEEMIRFHAHGLYGLAEREDTWTAFRQSGFVPGPFHVPPRGGVVAEDRPHTLGLAKIVMTMGEPRPPASIHAPV